MTVPRQIYDFIIGAIRMADQREGLQFLERYLTGPQSVWETNANIIQTIPDLWSVSDCPDEYLQYLKNIVGWTDNLDNITSGLTYNELRRLIVVSAELWKERGSEDIIQEVLYYVTGERNLIWNWFDFRWVLDETGPGEEHEGVDPWCIALPDPDELGSEYISNLRIVDSGSLNRTLVENLMNNIFRATGESWEITYLRFLDRFIIDSDDSQWSDSSTYSITVEDGYMQVGENDNDDIEVAWNNVVSSEWVSQITYARIKYHETDTNPNINLFINKSETTGSNFESYIVNGYCINYIPNTLYIRKYYDKSRYLSEILTSTTIELYEDIYYGFRVQLCWEGIQLKISIFIDGNLVIETTDYSPLVYPDGVGFLVRDCYICCEEIESIDTVDTELESYADILDVSYSNWLGPRYNINENSVSDYYNSNMAIYGRLYNRLALLSEGEASNYLDQSQRLDGSTWSVGNVDVPSITITAPNNTETASRIREDSSNSSHTVYQSSAFTPDGSSKYCFSVYAKGNGRDIQIVLSAGFPVNTYCHFDLVNGEVGTEGAGIDSSGIYDIGNDWYRCWVIATSDSETATSAYLYVTEYDETVTYLGDGSSGAYIWNTQIEKGYFPTSPIHTNTNLFTRAQEFNHSDWTKTRTTVTANTTRAPDGTLTADKLVEDSTSSNNHVMQQYKTPDGSSDYCFSVYAKAGERTWLRMNIATTGFTDETNVDFDLTNGVIGTSPGAQGSPSNYGIEDVGGGWYRCYISQESNLASSTPCTFYLCDTEGNESYNGDGSSGLYLWNAKLEIGDRPSVISLPTVNMVTHPNELDDSDWTKAQATISENSIVSPNGTLTADKLIEDSSDDVHAAYSASISYSDATQYVFSVYAKAGERDFIRINFASSGQFSGGALPSAYFDLTNGAVGTTTNLESSGIEYVGDDWYRCWIVDTTTSSGSSSVYIYLADEDGSNSYQGDGSSGLYLWHARVEPNSEPADREEPCMRKAGTASLALSSFSTSISKQRHSILWEPEFGTTEAPEQDFYIYTLYNSTTGQEVFLRYNSAAGAAGKIEMYANGSLVADTTVITFSAYQPMVITLDPTLGTIEVQGATTGGVSDTTNRWAQYVQTVMFFYLGSKLDGNANVFGKVSLPYSVT